MFRYLSLVLCLACAPAFAIEIVVSPGDAPRDYKIFSGDHLTVLEGAIVNELESYGGSMDILGGTFREDAFVAGGPFNISGGHFEGELSIPNATAPLTISGGVFDRSIRFSDRFGGGTVTITGGDFTGGNQALGIYFRGEGNVPWTAHIHGGRMTGVSAITGNSIHVYGHWLSHIESMFPDGHGVPRKLQTIAGVFADGSTIHWQTFGDEYIDAYVFHDLGELPGDTNSDQRIDIADLNNVRNNFGGVGEGDADFDGDTDIEDLNLVRNRFGLADEQLSISPVPESSAMALVCIGLTFLAASRRHHLARFH